jgi:hypothetical protein
MRRAGLETWVSIQLRQARTLNWQVVARFSGDTDAQYSTVPVAENLQIRWRPTDWVDFISRTLFRQVIIENFQQRVAMSTSVWLPGHRSVSQKTQHARNEFDEVRYLITGYARPEPDKPSAVDNILN